MRIRRVAALVALACIAVMLVACARPPSREPRPSAAIPISDIRTVTGKWEGMLEETPKPPEMIFGDYGGSWITVMITDNGAEGDGTFEFADYRMIGVFSGRGPLHLENGILHSESDKGHATYTLHEQGGQPMLEIDGVDKKGIRYHAELNRKSPQPPR